MGAKLEDRRETLSLLEVGDWDKKINKWMASLEGREFYEPIESRTNEIYIKLEEISDILEEIVKNIKEEEGEEDD